jgi:hypothetical protein
VANLYTPPQRVETHVIKGSLTYNETISTTVWKINGSWFNDIQPADESIRGFDWFFNTPTVVTDAVAAELVAYGVGTITVF